MKNGIVLAASERKAVELTAAGFDRCTYREGRAVYCCAGVGKLQRNGSEVVTGFMCGNTREAITLACASEECPHKTKLGH